jgi:hypothetical protein
MKMAWSIQVSPHSGTCVGNLLLQADHVVPKRREFYRFWNFSGIILLFLSQIRGYDKLCYPGRAEWLASWIPQPPKWCVFPGYTTKLQPRIPVCHTAKRRLMVPSARKVKSDTLWWTWLCLCWQPSSLAVARSTGSIFMQRWIHWSAGDLFLNSSWVLWVFHY